MSITRSVVSGIRNPKKAVTVMGHKLLATFGHNKFRRFIVLSRSRTGSNMLISLLNSHPNIHAEGEIFRELSGRNYKDVLEKAFARQPFHVKAKGFKIFYYHPLDDESGGVWDALASLDDLYVIHLKRRNILRTLISRKIAGIQDVWAIKTTDQHSGTDRKKIAVTFTVDELSEGFGQTREWEQAGEDTFRNHPLISIDYEDLVSHRESTFRKVTEFLGVRYLEPETNLRKQITKSMRETVTNYEELKSAFSGTEWQPFFDD
jgi:LPS sulfotransferase NodH